MAGSSGNTQLRELLLVIGPAVLLCLGAFWLAFQFVEPAPPKVIKMSTGGESGAYFRFGNRYAELMKAQGVRIEVVPSAGAIENAKRLDDPASGFKLGLLQGGIANSEGSPDLVSLGRVFLEPLWIFYRGEAVRTRLGELRGLRLAVGGEGGGTRALAETLLKANQVTAANATLLPLAGQTAVDALLAGEVDAIFLAFAPEAPIIQNLLRNRAVRLMNMAQAEAYTRIFPYLSRVVLPRGVVDLDNDIPVEDVSLVAAQAALVARKDLHPALAELMVDVVQTVHGKGGLFHRIGDFPKGQDPEFPMSDDAERIYKNG
ncbi:MAG: TAXI family TRAP transporter solute-binding subunit, partial [Hyphomicrobium sp.]